MKENKFVEVANKYFAEVLAPHGFENTKSKYCTFYRKISDDLFHVVLVEQGGNGSWFDVRVYATSSLIEPNFDRQFPDSLGIPAGNSSFLHPKFGISYRHKTFPCKTEDGFIRNFNKNIKVVLDKDAISFLDEIQSLSDLIPLINHDFYLGASLWYSGDEAKGREVLLSEKERLSNMADDSERILSLLNYIDKTLS